MASGTGATDTYFPPLNASKGSSCPQRASRKYFRTVTLLQSAAITYGVRTRGLGRGKGKQNQCKGERMSNDQGEMFGIEGPVGCRQHRRDVRGAPLLNMGGRGLPCFVVPREKEAGKVRTFSTDPVLPPLCTPGLQDCQGTASSLPSPSKRGKILLNPERSMMWPIPLLHSGFIAGFPPQKLWRDAGVRVRGWGHLRKAEPLLTSSPTPSHGPISQTNWGAPLGRLGRIWPEGNSIAWVIIQFMRLSNGVSRAWEPGASTALSRAAQPRPAPPPRLALAQPWSLCSRALHLHCSPLVLPADRCHPQGAADL